MSTCFIAAEAAVFPVSRSLWLAVLNSDIEESLEIIGSGYIEISPDDYSNRADRIVYYPEGLTLWSSGGKITQCRLDSAWKGMISGLEIGMTGDELRLKLGEPWIEETGSLYYNLPWNGGPVRLRLVYGDSGLREIYLYNVK